MNMFRGRELVRVRVIRAMPGMHLGVEVELPAFRVDRLMRSGFVVPLLDEPTFTTREDKPIARRRRRVSAGE